MKRVLHIISSMNWRGGERQVYYLFQHPSASYEKFLFCPSGSPLSQKVSDNNDRLITYKKLAGLDFFAALKLKRVVSEKKIDLLHLHDSHAINTYFLAYLSGLRIPAVVHRHVNFGIKSAWKYQLPGITYIICVSEQVKQTLSSRIHDKNVSVIHPGIDVKLFETSVRKRNQQENPGLLIGTVSSLEKEKNIPEFIRIASEMNSTYPDMRFRIAGDGSRKAEIITLIRNAGLETSVQLCGYLDDIPEFLSELDLFLFCSENEGFPMALLEAMAAGIPIVSANAGGVRDMIKDEYTGLLYTSGNIPDAVMQLTKLISNPILTQSLCENGLSYVQDFDVSLMNKQIELLYSSILQ